MYVRTYIRTYIRVYVLYFYNCAPHPPKSLLTRTQGRADTMTQCSSTPDCKSNDDEPEIDPIDRSDRWVDRSIGSIDSIDSIIFRNFWHVGELEICLVSKFQLCTTLGGRQNTKKLQRKNFGFVKFDAIDSITLIRSIRSIM